MMRMKQTLIYGQTHVQSTRSLVLGVVLGWLSVGGASAQVEERLLPDPDRNNDGVVNIFDVSIVGSCQGGDPDSALCRRADTDCNGAIDLDDFNFVVASFMQVGFPVGDPNNTPPEAEAGPNQTVPVAMVVALDGRASFDQECDPLAYEWAIVDQPAESASAVTDPTSAQTGLLIDAPGTYVISLVVDDGAAVSTPDFMTITTVNSQPIADAGADQTVLVGEEVQLNGSGSTDVDGDLLSFAWSLTSSPAGSAATLSSTSAINPTFVVDLPGTYVAELIVDDGFVPSVADTVQITTVNSPPVADAGGDQTVPLGGIVQLDGSASSDVDNDTLTFLWTLVDTPPGSVALLSDPAAESPTFTAVLPGLYVVELVVNDGLVDSDPDDVLIDTANSMPVADAGPDQGVVAGDTVSLDGTGSSDADGDLLSFHWAFTTLPDGSAAVLSDTTAQSPTFVADRAGVYVVQLMVDDGLLCSLPDTVMVDALAVVPNVAGTPQALAEASIEAAGLSVGVLSFSNSATVPAGSVISQSPESGNTVAAGAAVDLEISLGSTQVVVPDVVGFPLLIAQSTITSANLNVGRINASFSTTVPPDHVIEQNPTGGTSVNEGSAVDLVVSVGSPPPGF